MIGSYWWLYHWYMLVLLELSLEFQPVLIVSVGRREPSGDSGHTFLSSDGMWVEYILTHKNVR